MTREQAKALLPIVQAWSEGKVVQFRYPPNDWHDVPMGANPFVESDWEWRIKPEPREFWIIVSSVDGWKSVHENKPDKPLIRASEIVHVREVIDSASEPDSKPLKCPWCGTNAERDAIESELQGEDIFTCQKCGTKFTREGFREMPKS